MNIEKEAMEAWLEGDLVRAESLLLRAAKNESGCAAHNLGTLYAVGGPGIEASSNKSQRFYEQALALGFEKTVATDPTWFRKS